MLKFNSLKKLFAKKSAAKKQRPMRFRFEQLEDRQLMAADFTANLTNGVLEVYGSPKNDYIQVSELEGKVSVAGTKINTTSGLKFTVALRDVREVKIWGNDGDDTIKSDLGNIKSTVWGGNGRDTVNTDDGNDIIYGGIGADKLYGGDGNDQIYGGSENDTIDGQSGNDKLYGEAGDDVLRGYEGNDHLSGGIGVDSFDPDFEDTSGFDTFEDAFDLSKPVINGVRPEDVVQQDSYTCQTLGALAASADQGFNFGANIIFQGGSKYLVKIYTANGAKWQTVYFDGTWNDNDPMPANGQHEFWPILMQRARLNDLGISYNSAKTTEAWGADNQRTGGKLYNLYEALQTFTGRTTSGQYTTQARPESLRDSLARGDILVAGTSLGDNGKDKGKGVTSGIIGGHAYAIVDVFNQAGTWKVRMYNPYGRDIDKQANGQTLDGNGLAKDDGFITLDWAQFVKGLRVVVTAKKPVR